MGIVRFSSRLLAENLNLVLPRGWRGENFVGWNGGHPTPSSSTRGGSGMGSGGNAPPKASWLARFWSEVSLLEASTVPGLEEWPLLPITTGELVSCRLFQQVKRVQDTSGD